MEWTGRRTTRLHVYGESSTTDTSSGVPAGGITSAHASAGICGHLRARHGGPSGMRPPACIGRTNIPAWHAWASIIQPSVHDEPTFKPDHRCGKQPPARPSRRLPHTCHGASLHRSIARTTPCAARPLRLPAVKSHHPSIRPSVAASSPRPCYRVVTPSCSVVVRRRSSAHAPLAPASSPASSSLMRHRAATSHKHHIVSVVCERANRQTDGYSLPSIVVLPHTHPFPHSASPPSRHIQKTNRHKENRTLTIPGLLTSAAPASPQLRLPPEARPAHL